jgi:Protein of unknown function (DUF4231)
VPAEPSEKRRQAARRRCDEQINWYAKRSARARLRFAVVQSVAVVLAATTAVLILWSSLPKALQALLAALAAVAAALAGTSGWLQEHLRWSDAAETLKHERWLYEMRSPPDFRPELGEEAALALFVRRIEEMSVTENVRYVSRRASSGS